MKSGGALITSKFFSAALLVSLTQQLFSQTYTTIAPGLWDNTTTVWSTNGGATACLCAPPIITTNINVVINHAMTLSDVLTVGAFSTIDITASGSMTGPGMDVLVTADGTIEAYGPVDVLSIIIELDGDGIFHNTVICIDKFRVEGHAQIDTLVTVTNGDIEIKETGVLDIYVSFIEIDVPNGEFKVDGIMNMNNTCLNILNGGFRNKVTGMITGAQFIGVQNGEIRNEGIWPTAVDWCASGMAFTMPFPANCLGCSIFLPIELVSFSGSAGNDLNTLFWTTASELNNDFFTLLKSANGNDFFDIGTMQGAGTSSQYTSYEFVDDKPTSTLCYYQLQQTDFNGNTTLSDKIVVDNSAGEISPLTIAPNPAQDFIHLLFVESEDVFLVEITDYFGATVLRTQNNIILDISRLSGGIYFLKVSDNKGSVALKFVKL